MRLLSISSLMMFAACAPTTNFKKLTESPSLMRARPAADVELYFGVQPLKPYVVVGSFDRAPSDYMNDSLFDLTQDFRRSAAHEGCDAVIVPTGAQIETLTKEAKDVARATCVMYVQPASAPAAVTPAAMPVAAPASEPAKQ